jgi:predicted nucleotidyltransferase component of viral defense system
MITQEQIETFAKQYKIHETVIFREYLQVVFLEKLYQKTPSQKIFFKGGTAIHLIFKAPRFSEDLDFSVTLPMSEFEAYIISVLKRMEDEEGVTWKERKSVAGKQFLISAESILPYKIHITLDFSFREKILSADRTVLQTPYPIFFNLFVYHLSREEIFAEKIRAIMTRRKGRDLYDLWYLLSIGAEIRHDMLLKKLAYYEISDISNADIVKRVASFSQKDFVIDLRPFVPINERNRLSKFFEVIQTVVQQNLGVKK